MKGFSQKEKEIIHQKLQIKAREFFGNFGLKKTSIEDLTKAVGIAKGTFYIFFKSKEELFFKVLENESKIVRDKFKVNLKIDKSNPNKTIEDFLNLSIQEIKTNPIFKKVLIREELELIYRKLSPEQIEEHRKESMAYLYNFVKSLQEIGILKDGNPEVIAGAMRSLFFLPLHRNEIGDDIFDQSICLLTKVVAQGLTSKS